jgi:hypothetical protein
MLAGLAAGVVTYLFAVLVGEPQLSSAIALEAAHTPVGGAEPELVTRGVQATVGLAVAVLVYSAAVGGVLGVICAGAQGRVTRLGPRALSLLVGALGFVSTALVPFLKYPANPPAVGHPETIGQRTGLYVTMTAVAVLAMVAAVLAGRRAAPRFGPANATLLAAAVFGTLVIVAAAVLPGVDEVPEAFPASLLWRFRLASVGTQLMLWTALGVVFALTARSAARSSLR